MPALHMSTSRRVDSARNRFAAFWTEVRLERSHSMNVSMEAGELFLTLEMSSSARALLRPLKKMWDGFCAASIDVDSAPNPAVPRRFQHAIFQLVETLLRHTSSDEEHATRLAGNIGGGIEGRF